MNKTLTLSPAVLLSLILTIAPAIGGGIWWMSSLESRISHTVKQVAKIKTVDTSGLKQRIATLEAENKNLKEQIGTLREDMYAIEESLGAWWEREFKKVWDYIKSNPLMGG